MNKFVAKKSKEDAIQAIKRQEHKLVQLDYAEGGQDVIELGRLGRKYMVAVSFISQISIRVRNIEAMNRELDKPKDTYQQRFLFAEFEMDSEIEAQMQSKASSFGDMVFRSEDFPGTNSEVIWE